MVSESTESLAELFAKVSAERDEWRSVAAYLVAVNGGTAYIPSTAFGSVVDGGTPPSLVEEPCSLGDIRKFVVRDL